MSKLSGDFEAVDQAHQLDMDYVSEHMQAVMTLPGTGENSYANTSSIDEMLEAMPNLEWVGVVVSWFATGLDIANDIIKPGIEKSSDESEDDWLVSSYNRTDAHQIYRSNQLDPTTVRYGGTAPDSDVLSYIQEIKDKGLKVAFYPFIMVDDVSKSWRGSITGDAEDVSNFYKKQYKPFIMHYAGLLKDVVDMFYIGSELEGLTSIKGKGRKFPFVDSLVDLASSVRSEVGNDVLISYAANWTEYHSCCRGYRPLDKLWSNQNIDFVGIDYYMPLTDSEEVDISINEIKAGFYSGEGYDYYLSYTGERLEFNNDCDRWKDLAGWFSSKHWAWDPESEESYKTAWVAESKRVIFSEFGFRSVELASNTPNVYGDVMPKHSSGKVDFPMQMRAIHATLEHISEDQSIEMGFCYGWDSRGSGWTRNYADGDRWAKGHWIDGKIVRIK